ncbi:hypothetical protein OXPF_09930 [Oxobacter pfennigii]|uniref:NfeD-like C-terminal domain-containing protein n=1 Tax=Oxobacter pfennigii TaxID=36849 RepID=A0A0P8WDB0_9CLOT|nr:NfeD family protein [Oxobacter pfennigii]KPU45759.1 hypothetical protein OXPF_09930 [Oxobacter pfennigii]
MGSILFWLIISIAALIADIITSSFFLSGFTVGGIFALLAKVLKIGFTGQIMVFAIVSSIAIAGEYYWLKKKLNKTIPKTNKMEEEYIGRIMTANEDIGDKGRIKIDGIYWAAENDGESIRIGDKFEVTGIKGNRMIVKKVV